LYAFTVLFYIDSGLIIIGIGAVYKSLLVRERLTY